MADTLDSLWTVLINSVYTQDKALANTPDGLNLSRTARFTTGTGANQANFQYHEVDGMAASASDTYDLADASNSRKDVFGNAMNLSSVKVLFVKNTSALATIQIDTSLANGWVTAITALVIIPPGGYGIVIAPDATGYAVTAGTGDQLKITNNDGVNAATYEIIILGLTN